MSFSLIMKATLAGASLLVLAACDPSGADDEPIMPRLPSDVTLFVPAAVSTDAMFAASYTAALASTDPAVTDTLEPVDVPETLAQDDTAEPA